jgi:hypothetical protein
MDNYWIRAQPSDTTAVDGINMAILRYAGAVVAQPTTTSNLTNPMLETNLHPLMNSGAPGNPQRGDVDIALTLNMSYNASNFAYYINGATFTPPTAPVLLQILSGARSAHELLPPGSVYTLPRNKTVEVTIPAIAKGSPVSKSSLPLARVIHKSLLMYSILSICTEYVLLLIFTAALINTFPSSIPLTLSGAPEALLITTITLYAVALLK